MQIQWTKCTNRFGKCYFFGGEKTIGNFTADPCSKRKLTFSYIVFWFIFLCLLMEFIFRMRNICNPFKTHTNTYTHTLKQLHPTTFRHSHTKFLIEINWTRFFFKKKKISKFRKCFYENEKALNGNRNANHKTNIVEIQVWRHCKGLSRDISDTQWLGSSKFKVKWIDHFIFSDDLKWFVELIPSIQVLKSPWPDIQKWKWLVLFWITNKR